MLTRVPRSIIVLIVSAGTTATAADPPLRCEFVGNWDGGGSHADVWSDGSYAYIGRYQGSFVDIVDITDPANPTLVMDTRCQRSPRRT